MHETTAVTLVELRHLFVTRGAVRTDLREVKAAIAERDRRHRLVLQLLRYIDTFNRMQPDMVLAKPETLLASALSAPDLLGTTLDDVRKALQFLETIGAIAPSNGDGYVSQTTLNGALALIDALAQLDRNRLSADALAPNMTLTASEERAL